MTLFDFSGDLPLYKVLRQLQEYLHGGGIEAADFGARQLLFSVLGLDGSGYLIKRSLPFSSISSAEQKAKLVSMAYLRTQGEPLQYLLGEWEFFGRKFFVGPGVLIPRGDTETLIEAVLEQSSQLPQKPVCVDLCSGSGCIAVTLAAELSRLNPVIIAAEWSDQAMPYLEKNVRYHSFPVEIRKLDVLDLPSLLSLPVCHLLVSNPPYIPRAVLPGLSQEVKNEPEMALDGGTDGLMFYRAILSALPTLLAPGGMVFFEVGYDQGQVVQNMMGKAGLEQLKTYQDLNGISRVVSGKKPCSP